jgi:polyhydroxyalkanoate synthesis regulator phasin
MAAPASGDAFRALEELLAELPARMRGSREKATEETVGVLRNFVRELGLATREEVDELELRVAQLEHRLRLMERAADTPPTP